jgi:hypothetical protein
MNVSFKEVPGGILAPRGFRAAGVFATSNDSAPARDRKRAANAISP